MRRISKLSDGMRTSCASMIMGTRRTIPSRSGTMVKRPRPAAASSSTLTLRSSPPNLNSQGVGVLAKHGEAGDRQLLVEIRVNVVSPGFAEHHARLPDGVSEDPIIAGQRLQLFARRLVKTAEIIGGDVGIEPVRLGENHVERDHDRAHPGQSVDDIGDARARPWPLAEPGIGQALLVDVDDGDRPCLLHPGIDKLEGIESADSQLFHRRRIDGAQHGEDE